MSDIPKTLLAFALKKELKLFLEHSCLSFTCKKTPYGNAYFSDHLIAVYCGLGEEKYSTSLKNWLHFFDQSVSNVIGSGIAGSLAHEVHIGDLILSTQQMNHSREDLPPITTPSTLIAKFPIQCVKNLKIHLGPTTSADENILTEERRQELFSLTSALGISWEGYAGAKTCLSLGRNYIEIRGISDLCEPPQNPADFNENMTLALKNLTLYIDSLFVTE